ncbi:MAG: GNAT family N-acetyltransferase [Synechococcales bacterium]|nr:GNAT family N-acetyltransferase [Synechococcales bacterium]
MSQPVITHYLEMHSSAELQAKANGDPDFSVTECQIKQYPVNQFLYRFVGAAWQWTDKLVWTDDQWRAYAEAENLRTWIAYKLGSPAGYYELRWEGDRQVELAYFGLAERFIGQGHGGYLLSHAIQSAWDWGAQRVWVHTCSQDHPHALGNYQARGFKIYRVETEEKGQAES